MDEVIKLLSEKDQDTVSFFNKQFYDLIHVNDTTLVFYDGNSTIEMNLKDT